MTGVLFGFTGSVAAAFIEPSDTVTAALVAAVAGGAILVERRARTSHLPSWHRQVNEDWMATYRGWVYGAGFGFQLGLGLVTFITSGAVYVTFAMAFLSGSWFWGLVIGLVFGVARAGMAFSVAGVRGPEQLRSTHRRLQHLAAPAQRLAAGAQALIGVVALGAVVV